MASCFGTLPPSGWEKALRPPVTGARAARAEGKCAKVVKAAVRPVSAVCRSKRLRTLPLLRASRNLEVMERYLKYRWTDHVPSLKEPPEGGRGCNGIPSLGSIFQAANQSLGRPRSRSIPDRFSSSRDGTRDLTALLPIGLFELLKEPFTDKATLHRKAVLL